MKFIKTDIEGLLILEPVIFKDNRGIFLECFNNREFRDNGIEADFVQDNLSVSHKGVIRGLHFQEQPHEQGKLVRVAHGKALDVVVDIRTRSSSYGKTFSIELSSDNNKMLWIPAGFAHGFEALSEEVVFSYKVTAYYNQASEKGILYNDPQLNIRWYTDSPFVSSKDLTLPLFSEGSNYYFH